jgi:hypothetical protein
MKAIVILFLLIWSNVVMAAERKYSVSEIVEMRKILAHSTKWEPGTSIGTNPTPKEIEEQLQTYILAGVGPEELEAERIKQYNIMAKTLDDYVNFLNANPDLAKQLDEAQRKAFGDK